MNVAPINPRVDDANAVSMGKTSKSRPSSSSSALADRDPAPEKRNFLSGAAAKAGVMRFICPTFSSGVSVARQMGYISRAAHASPRSIRLAARLHPEPTSKVAGAIFALRILAESESPA
jgi:hypothetical protein